MKIFINATHAPNHTHTQHRSLGQMSIYAYGICMYRCGYSGPQLLAHTHILNVSRATGRHSASFTTQTQRCACARPRRVAATARAGRITRFIGQFRRISASLGGRCFGAYAGVFLCVSVCVVWFMLGWRCVFVCRFSVTHAELRVALAIVCVCVRARMCV